METSSDLNGAWGIILQSLHGTSNIADLNCGMSWRKVVAQQEAAVVRVPRRLSTRAFASTSRPPLRTWTTPTLLEVGRLDDILQSGGGKLSLVGGDPGEMRCERPHESRCE